MAAPREGDVPFASASPDGRLPGPRRLSRWWFLAFISPGLLLLLVLLLFPHGHGHGCQPIHVRGRLVWAGSREGVGGARVLTVRRYDLERDFDAEAEWSDLQAYEAERRENGIPYDPESEQFRSYVEDHGDSRSDTSGRFAFWVGLRTTIHCGPLWHRTEVQDPADAVAALWIAPEGREGVVVHLDPARWRKVEGEGAHDLWDTYDLGTVEVPEGAP